MARLFDRVWTWRIIVLLSVSLVSVLAVQYWRQVWAYKEVLGFAASTIVALWQWFMGRDARFYMFMAKGKALLTNSQVGYSVAASFEGESITTKAFEEVCDRLFQLGERRETLSRTQDRVVVRVEGLVVALKFRLTTDVDDDVGSISCEVLEYHAPYDPASVVLQEKIVPLLHELEDMLSPADKSYLVTVRFQGENPFLGVYAKLIRPDNLRQFHCEIFEPEVLKGTASSRTVKISKEQLDLCASDLHGLTSLIAKHLALAGR